MKTKEAGAQEEQPAGKLVTQKVPSREFSRKAFFRNLGGRLLTLGIGLAAAAGSDNAVDSLLRLKDKHNRWGRA